MQWSVKLAGTEQRHDGLTTEQVARALSEGKIQSEDWASLDDGETWRQLAQIDEFSSILSGARRRKRAADDRDEEAEMDMTPMIDVTFLLLIFFMITASFHLQKGLDFPPSETSEENTEAEQAPGLSAFADHLVVEIDARDRFSLKDVAAGDHMPGAFIAPDRIVETLRTQTTAKKLKKVLVLAHENSSHEAMVLVIDASGQAGIKEVSVADVQKKGGVSPAPSGAPPRVIRRN